MIEPGFRSAEALILAVPDGIPDDTSPQQRSRVSKLAVTAFTVAVATCPALLLVAVDLLSPLSARHGSRVNVFIGIFLINLAGFAISIAAARRIYCVRGKVRGATLADWALQLSAAWCLIDWLVGLILQPDEV